MQNSLKTGFSFGLTSGIITTLGLIVGLHSGTHSKFVIIGGILTIAVADAFSDALGMHISKESENQHSEKQIWMATLSTLLTKFAFAITFVVPILLLALDTAIIASIIWGLSLLGIFSFYISKKQKVPAWKVVFEHVAIALIVITITHFVGDFINTKFS